MVDCMLCYAATELVDKMTAPNDPDGRAMLDRVKAVSMATPRNSNTLSYKSATEVFLCWLRFLVNVATAFNDRAPLLVLMCQD